MYGFCQLAAPKFENYKVVKVGVYGFIPEYTVLNSFYTDILIAVSSLIGLLVVHGTLLL